MSASIRGSPDASRTAAFRASAAARVRRRQPARATAVRARQLAPREGRPELARQHPRRECPSSARLSGVSARNRIGAAFAGRRGIRIRGEVEPKGASIIGIASSEPESRNDAAMPTRAAMSATTSPDVFPRCSSRRADRVARALPTRHCIAPETMRARLGGRELPSLLPRRAPAREPDRDGRTAGQGRCAAIHPRGPTAARRRAERASGARSGSSTRASCC